MGVGVQRLVKRRVAKGCVRRAKLLGAGQGWGQGGFARIARLMRPGTGPGETEGPAVGPGKAQRNTHGTRTCSTKTELAMVLFANSAHCCARARCEHTDTCFGVQEGATIR